MRKCFLAAAAALALAGCKSVEYATVSSSDVVANGGDAVAVIQVSVVGLTAIFHLIDLYPADLDEAINKGLVAEAKALGAAKVELKSVSATPRQGIFRFWGALIGFPTATATGIAVK